MTYDSAYADAQAMVNNWPLPWLPIAHKHRITKAITDLILACPRWAGSYHGYPVISDEPVKETHPMTRLADYTTEELTRLTTLTPERARAGEYLRNRATTVLRTNKAVSGNRDDYGVFVDANGDQRCSGGWDIPMRRVTSFTDPTELDPPQAEMVQELERRRRPRVSNATHGGRRAKGRDSQTYTLLDAYSASICQEGWKAKGYTGQYVWGVNTHGYLAGNNPETWQLLD